jgi:hypothetical protein
MTQQKIASMKCLRLEAGAVTGDEEPMADLASQEFDRTDGGKLTAKFWIHGVRAFRKNQPNAVVTRRFGMIAEHAKYSVAQVDRKPGKHATHLWV